jgi:hypothetical protein
MANWPVVQSQAVFDRSPRCKERIANLLRHGLVVHTDFSGKLGPEVTLRMLEMAWRELGVKLPFPTFDFHRGCDLLKTSQHLMMRNRDGPHHVFHDLLGRLPDEGRRAVNEMRPLPDSSLQTRSSAFASMEAYLFRNRHEFFGVDKFAHCLMHGQRCPVNRDLSQYPEDQRPLSVAIAGTMCTPFSPIGKKDGVANMASEPWHLWSVDMCTTQHDIIMLENSHRFPEALWKKRIDRSHSLVSLVFDVADLGWPCHRKRYLSWAVKDSDLVWLGPTAPEDVREDFMRFFQRRCQLDSDVFAGLGDEGAGLDTLRRMASRRGKY